MREGVRFESPPVCRTHFSSTTQNHLSRIHLQGASTAGGLFKRMVCTQSEKCLSRDSKKSNIPLHLVQNVMQQRLLSTVGGLRGHAENPRMSQNENTPSCVQAHMPASDVEGRG